MALVSIVGPHAQCLASELRPLLPESTHWVDQPEFLQNPRAIDWLLTEEDEGRGLWVMVGSWLESALLTPNEKLTWELWGEQVDIWINTGPDIGELVPANAAWPPEAWAQYIQKLLEVQGVSMDES